MIPILKKLRLLYIFGIIVFSSCADLFLTEKVIECYVENPEFTYTENIKPILETNCTVCHNINNQSGGLSVSSFDDFNLSRYIVPGDTSQGAIERRPIPFF